MPRSYRFQYAFDLTRTFLFALLFIHLIHREAIVFAQSSPSSVEQPAQPVTSGTSTAERGAIEIVPSAPMQFFGDPAGLPAEYQGESAPADSFGLAPGETLLAPHAELEMIQPGDVHIKQLEPDVALATKLSL